MLLALLALAAPASATIVVGLGDQKPDMFSDPRFVALGITHARRAVAWDAMWHPDQVRQIDRWMRAAHADGVSPLISFDHSDVAGHHKDVPSAALFGRAFHLFRSRYPWVTDFAAWNEANYCGEEMCRHPAAVASYYLVMRHACPKCNVLAAELLDVAGMASWVHSFLAAARTQPALWGLHDYVGANRFSDATTRQLLSLVRGRLWLTEVAGLVARRNHSNVGFPQSPAHAADVTAYIFGHLARLSPRIQRVYHYEWNAHTGHDAWDSALISPNGQPRPAYAVFARAIAALGMAPNCSISRLPPACAA
jgi:hypothetical protein